MAVEAGLKQLQGEGCLTQLLHDHVLIARMEEAVILERPVVKEIRPDVQVGDSGGVIAGVDDSGVGGVGRMRV